ncbi:MAG: DUF1080 domain-containing protein [Verrucomicrobiota bacterium]
MRKKLPGETRMARQSFSGVMAAVQRISLSLAGNFVRLADMMRCLWLICFALAGSAVGAELVLDFGVAGADQTPPGFTNTLAGTGRLGRWRAVPDEVPGTTNNTVLAQTSMEVVDERFPLLIYQKTKFDDFTLTTKFKLVEGVVEQMAGIVFRYQDEKGFYIIRASGLGSNVRFYKVVGGIRSQPIGPSVAVPKGEWHELKIECRGNKIRAWLNGREAIPELTDTSFASGKIGFWTKSDSLSRFADTRIVYTPREPLAQAIVRDIVKTYPRLVGVKIYVRDEQGEPRIVASKDPKELGTAGGPSESGAITNGNIYYGREKSTVSVVQPLRDQNGEPIAAVRMVMKSFPGQTEQAVLQRALPMIKEIQARVRSLEELQ